MRTGVCGMERIKLDLKVSRLGIFLNIAAVIAFIGALSFILINWSTLPESVPSHYFILILEFTTIITSHTFFER